MGRTVTWEDDSPGGRRYQSVEAWVADWLAPTYRRSLDTGARVWCPEWHEHPEAVSRLEALWLAWEHLWRDERTGLAEWWLRYADPTMAVLLDPVGPFQRCTKGHTNRVGPLPTQKSQ